MNLAQKPILRVEEYPEEQQSWLGDLFTQLNPFFTSLNSILNNNVDFSTNIPSVSRSYSIDSFQPFSLKWIFPALIPTSVQVTHAYNEATSLPTILLAAWEYDASKTSIKVTSMLEITEAGNIPLTGKYTFNLRASV